MAEPARRAATYQDLYRLPEGMTGEIVNGELVATPRPSRLHTFTASALGAKISGPYLFGEGGGPGGWIILDEPEIAFGSDLLVPDLAGWGQERFPVTESHNWIGVPPDWVCEILSPASVRTDKTGKMPVYAQHGVHHLWLIDPLAMTLDVFRLEAGRWTVVGLFAGSDQVRAEPFPELALDLASLWLPSKLPAPAPDR
ncbi:MAG: Uma2 family endonuclease [Thermodesulfobacteriota bacterium]